MLSLVKIEEALLKASWTFYLYYFIFNFGNRSCDIQDRLS